MIGKQDELIKAMPTQTNTASPALTGAPPSVTGGVGTGTIPPMQSGGPALASAPLPGGNAQVEGAPLSQDGANERQGGAGANLDLDLVRDRGTPMEYWNSSMEKLGSKKAMQFMGRALNAASGKTGEFAKMDPEEVRRAGNQLNEAMGIKGKADQDELIEQAIVSPFANLTRKEINNGTISDEDGATRMMQMMMNVQGVESEADIEAIAGSVYDRLFGGKKK